MSLLKKLPSYDFLLNNAVDSFKRFPLTLVCAVVGTSLAVYMLEYEKMFDELILQQKLIALSALGIPLSLALTFLAEKLKFSKIGKLAFQGITILFLIIYYFTLPEAVFEVESHAIRFAVLFTGFHFLVACLPYLMSGESNGFWQYNKSLFIKFLIATLFGNVLMYGLMIALAAADHLFGMDVEGIRYPQVGFIVTGIIMTWIFLASLPKDLDKLDSIESYPKGIRGFAQYILMPLVLLYFVILFTYELKIIINWNWPKGWVSNLVLWYSVVGILSLLLLNPIREKIEYKWVKVFSNWFYRLLVPLVGMLFLAIIVRVSDYGITESRYYVLAMAVGLSVVTLYFIFSRKRDIRIIPIVLTMIALLSAFGPWSAFSASKSSQTSRLEKLMIDNGILVEGKIQKTESVVSLDDKKNISSIVSYLIDRHGPESFEKWLDSTEYALLEDTSRYSQDKIIINKMGFEYVSRYTNTELNNEYYHFTSNNPGVYELGSYQLAIDYNFVSYISKQNDTSREYISGGKKYIIKRSNIDKQLEFIVEKLDGTFSSKGVLKYIDIYNNLKEFDSIVPSENMKFIVEIGPDKFNIFLNNIKGNFRDDQINVYEVNFMLLISKR